jgi:hypothetical protein
MTTHNPDDADGLIKEIKRGNFHVSNPQANSGEILTAFQNVQDFIRFIHLPPKICVGDEYVSTTEPTIILIRGKRPIRELFSWPLFHVTKKIRVRFHWDGIEVLGSNMESPNCFLFSIPEKYMETYKWYLKISCLPTCSTGKKTLYLSIETLSENLLLKVISIISKFLAIVALLACVCLPFFYYFSSSVKANIDQLVYSEPQVGYLSIPALILFVIILFSKQMDDSFSTLLNKERDPGLVNENIGGKFVGGGITVIPASKSREDERINTIQH